MFLFEEDWDRYPRAVLDYNCPNRSFLNYSLLLKEMGIRNWKFPIALINSDLLGKDPHSPNLSLEEMAMFSEEFRLNPWSYFRLCARAPGSTPETPIYFTANRSNMSMYWLYFNHITVCLVQPRQTGKTFGSTSLDAYLLNIGSVGGRTLLLTKDEGLRAKTLTEIKKLEDLFPVYLKQHSKNDIGNREEINVSSLDNNYKALVARNDPIAADKTGRGHTVENTRVDETAYLFHLEIAMKSLLPATTAARQVAERRGNPYGNIFMTTAGKKDERDGQYAYNYFHDAAPWSEHYMNAKNIDELRALIKGASRDGKVLRVHCVFSHRQLGYTDEWLRNTAAENNSSGEAYERDYLNIWTSGSQHSPFTTEDATRVRNSQKEIAYAHIHPVGQIVIRWYHDEDTILGLLRSRHVICAVDTSDGIGRDDIAVSFRDLSNGELLGACTINEINLMTVAQFFVELLFAFSKLTMIIERRNQAASIVDYMHKKLLERGIDPFKRMYNEVVQNYVEFPDRYREICKTNQIDEFFLAQYKKYFGFTTTGTGTTARSELYGTTLRQAIKYTGDAVKDKPTIDQLLSLTIRNGRIDHPVGGHDDLCFVGSTLVRTIDGNRPISELKIGDLVLTREGYKPILHIYYSQKEVISKFGLTGTSNHPFITPSGIVSFEDLNQATVVYTWNEKLSSITEKSITDILNQKENNFKDIIIVTTRIKKLLSPYTDKYGKTIMVLFQKVMKYIIKTITILTTQMKIWNVFPQETIGENTLHLNNLDTREVFELEKKGILINGVKKIQKKLKNTLEITGRKVQEYKNGVKLILNWLKKFIKPLPRKVSKPENVKENVYNLCVSECHEYFVNDILVHNCVAWLLTYWFMVNGRNLQHYGIPSGYVLSENKTINSSASQEELYQLELAKRARNYLEYLMTKLDNERDSHVIERIAIEIENVKKTMGHNNEIALTVDTMLGNIRKNKQTQSVVKQSLFGNDFY